MCCSSVGESARSMYREVLVRIPDGTFMSVWWKMADTLPGRGSELSSMIASLYNNCR